MLIKLVIIQLFFCFSIQTEFMMKCDKDLTCVENYNDAYSCIEGHCHHKPLFPLNKTKVVAIINVILISALANAGGIGGGCILIPVYTFMLDFTIGDSIPLSKATILSGAVIHLILSYNNRMKDDPNKLIIDYRLAVFIVPLILAGTMVGIFLTKLLPSILIFAVLLIYLGSTIFKTYFKARELDEIEKNKKIKKLLIEENFEMKTITKSKQNKANVKDKNLEGIQMKLNESKSFNELIAPYKKNLFFCFLIYMAILIVAMLKGGDGFDSLIGLDSCSITSWILFFIAQLFGILGSYRIYKIEEERVLQQQRSLDLIIQNKTNQSGSCTDGQKKVIIDSLIRESIRIEVSPNLLSQLYIPSYLAGVLAGTLGIGGGMVINPVLLKEKFNPEIAAAVSGFIVFFTSLSTTTQFIIAGAFDFEYAIYIFFFSGLGALIGHIVFSKILAYYNKPSTLVWLLFLLLGFSFIILAPLGAFKIIKQENAFLFGKPC